MPTPSGVLTGTVQWDDYVESAFDTTVRYALRDMPQFRQLVDVRPITQAMPGQPVVLTIDREMPLATTPLVELSDIDAVAPGDPRRVLVTVEEYGSASVVTELLSHVDFTAATIMRLGRQIAKNQIDSLDELVRGVCDTADNVLFSVSDTGPGDTTGPATNHFNSFNAAAAASLLRGRLAEGKEGELYVSYIHPDVSYDLRTQSGDQAWVNPKQYVDTSFIYAGEIGTFQGSRFVETKRCTVVEGVDPAPDIYTTYFFGREAVVEVSNIEPHTVVREPIDKLKRFFTIGWKAQLGWNVYRNNAIQLVESTSTFAEQGLVDHSTYDPAA